MPSKSSGQPTSPEFARRDIANTPVLIREVCFPDENGSTTFSEGGEDLCIILVLSGVLRVEVEDSSACAQEGDILLINMMWDRKFCAEDSCRFYLIHANPVLFQNSIALPKYILEKLLPTYPAFYLLKKDSADAPHITDLILRTAEMPSNSLLTYRLTIIGYLHLILAGILASYENVSSCPDQSLPDAGNLNKMMNYIHHNYQSKIRLDDIADAGNVSRSRCSPIFRKYMHVTPIEYVNDYRLEVSRGYLLDRNLSIASIASACGFSGQSYYTKLFVRKYGCTPSAYRTQNA